MGNHLTSRSAVLFGAGGFLAALFLSGDAQAITDTVFKYSAAKTGRLPIPAAAFTPEGSAVKYVNLGGELGPLTTSDACFHAPVNLANGAKMTTLVTYYASNADA